MNIWCVCAYVEIWSLSWDLKFIFQLIILVLWSTAFSILATLDWMNVSGTKALRRPLYASAQQQMTVHNDKYSLELYNISIILPTSMCVHIGNVFKRVVPDFLTALFKMHFLLLQTLQGRWVQPTPILLRWVAWWATRQSSAPLGPYRPPCPPWVLRWTAWPLPIPLLHLLWARPLYRCSLLPTWTLDHSAVHRWDTCRCLVVQKKAMDCSFTKSLEYKQNAPMRLA